ncbi:MAG: DUF2490 domain-containing protein [Acidimicrobiia bacterium]|nr:DUF2490 domain-containing protein [Acidimicrobiia bacterium]
MGVNRTKMQFVRCLLMVVGVLLGLLIPKEAVAQGSAPVPSTDDDSELWMAVQFAMPLRERTDLVLAGSYRQGRDFSHPAYETGAVALRLRLGRRIALSPLYQFVATQYYPGVHTRENRLAVSTVFSFPVKGFIIDEAHQLEQRFRQPRNSNRYRNRVQVERPFRFHDAQYRVFAWDEVFYDWGLHAWSRNRFSVGAGKRLNSSLGIDLFFLKQNARFSRPRDINAVGITFRIQLQRPIHHFP